MVQAQAVKGGAVLAFTLDWITLKGQRHSIKAREFEQAGKGRGQRTARGWRRPRSRDGCSRWQVERGTADAAFTGRRDTSLPAETRLHFELAKALRVHHRRIADTPSPV